MPLHDYQDEIITQKTIKEFQAQQRQAEGKPSRRKKIVASTILGLMGAFFLWSWIKGY